MRARDFRDKDCCVSVEKLLWSQLILERERAHQPTASVRASLSKMGYSYIYAQLCCMHEPTYSPIKWEGQCVVFFSPEVSSPTRYKETRNRSTMAAKEEKKKQGGGHTERKREREDRSIIHGGKKADCEEMLDFGSLPPRVQYFGLYS